MFKNKFGFLRLCLLALLASGTILARGSLKCEEVSPPRSFDFEIKTDEAAEFRFKVYDAVDFEVDWGDGFAEVEDGDRLLSRRFDAGRHVIKVKGRAGRIAFGCSDTDTTPELLKDILTPLYPAVAGINSAYEMFAGAEQIKEFTEKKWFDDASSGIANMGGMFRDAENFNCSSVENWDTGNVSNMRGTFRSASSLDRDLGGWDVSSVSDLYYFAAFSGLGFDMSGWNVSGLRSGSHSGLGSAFRRSSIHGDINHWDVSGVNNFANMFNGNDRFNSYIGDWDMSDARRIDRMFHNSVFDQDISSWDLTGVVRMGGFLSDAEFSSRNYDLLLIGLTEFEGYQTLNHRGEEMVFDVSAQYSRGRPEEARQYMMDTYNWTFNDLGVRIREPDYSARFLRSSVNHADININLSDMDALDEFNVLIAYRADNPEEYIMDISNPYEAVDFGSFKAYKGQMHTHTMVCVYSEKGNIVVYRSGRTVNASTGEVISEVSEAYDPGPRGIGEPVEEFNRARELDDAVRMGSDGRHNCTGEVIIKYSDAGYDILALTDHNNNTWPWSIFIGQEPVKIYRNPDEGFETSALYDGLGGEDGMLAIRGNEYSTGHHRVGIFTERTSTPTFVQSGQSKEIEIIAHPTRYSYDLEWYLERFAYTHVAGMEVYNKGNTDGGDKWDNNKVLWDAVNRERGHDDLVWGFAHDDNHWPSHFFRDYQHHYMKELTEEAFRENLRQGAFTFSHEPEGANTRHEKFGESAVPMLTNVSIEGTEITIEAEGVDVIKWYDDDTAKLFKTNGAVSSINVSDYDDLAFVRAVMRNEYGSTYTQPFGYSYVNPEEWQTTERQSLTEPGDYGYRITGLKPGKQYEFRVVAEYDGIKEYTDARTFITAD